MRRRLEDDGFRAFGEYLIGYTAKPPADCRPGQTIAGAGGSCLCPASDLPPTRANDCRVFDSDMDGHPGYSVVFTGGINRTDYVRHKDTSQIVMGKISAQKRHSALYQYSHDHFTLECGSAACPVSEYEPCLLDESQALFYPLESAAPAGAEWSCAEILRRSGAFFPTTPLARSCD